MFTPWESPALEAGSSPFPTPFGYKVALAYYQRQAESSRGHAFPSAQGTIITRTRMMQQVLRTNQLGAAGTVRRRNESSEVKWDFTGSGFRAPRPVLARGRGSTPNKNHFVRFRVHLIAEIEGSLMQLSPHQPGPSTLRPTTPEGQHESAYVCPNRRFLAKRKPPRSCSPAS